jgi:hypothetical protein
MKLYLKNCPNCGHRNYLGVQASTKNGLRVHFGGDNFYATCGNCGHQAIYYVQDVKAFSDSNVTPGGAIAGGLIGLLGGPLGLVIGGIAGGLLGTANDNEDQRKANVFNASR